MQATGSHESGVRHWGLLLEGSSYEFFIAFLKQASRCGFRSLQGCWQVLTYWAQGYIPALHPQYIDQSSEIYPRAYAWSLCYITRREVTQAMSKSWAQCWFWALLSWMFFLAERTYHQVTPIFRVPNDPPQELTHFEIILDNSDYMTGSFNGFALRTPTSSLSSCSSRLDRLWMIAL